MEENGRVFIYDEQLSFSNATSPQSLFPRRQKTKGKDDSSLKRELAVQHPSQNVWWFRFATFDYQQVCNSYTEQDLAICSLGRKFVASLAVFIKEMHHSVGCTGCKSSAVRRPSECSDADRVDDNPTAIPPTHTGAILTGCVAAAATFPLVDCFQVP